MRWHRGLVLVLLLSTSAGVSAQSSSLALIRERLQDWRWMAQQDAFVFVGEIGTTSRIPTRRCSAGYHEKLDYIVHDVLWSSPDSYLQSGYVVSKGFIDCTEMPLPMPFHEGSKVIVLCGIQLGHYACLPPVEATTANRNRVQSWVDNLRRAGEPVLLQIHERILEDGDLLDKSTLRVPGTFRINGEPVRPLVFSGLVKWIEPIPTTVHVVPRRSIAVSISRVLWGDNTQPQIRAYCNSTKCGGVQVGWKVLGYCRLTPHEPQECLISLCPSELGIFKLKHWLVERGLETQADSDFEEIHAEADGTSMRYQNFPYLFIGEISGLGPVPHVLVCKQAVNQDVEFSISTVLRGKPPNAIVKTSYVNCSSQPLPSPPFSLHATVIGYCEQTHVGGWDRCLMPVPLTAERLRKVQEWTAKRQANQH